MSGLKAKMESLFHDTLKAAAKVALSVEQLEDKTIADERISICSTCENRDAKNDKCKVCGCYLEIKTQLKTNINPIYGVEVTHCPLGKWGDTEIANHYRARRGQQLIQT